MKQIYLPCTLRFTLVVFLIGLSTPLFSASVSWDGGAGDSQWTSPANWSDDVLPGSDDEVTIDGSFTLTLPSGNHTILSLEIKGGASLTIADGATLTVNADNSVNYAVYIPENENAQLTINGTLTLSGDPTNGGLYIDYWGNQEVEIGATGQLNAAISGGSGSALYFGTSLTNDGTITITDAPGHGLHVENELLNVGTINISGVGGNAIQTGGNYCFNLGTVNITGAGGQGIQALYGFFNDAGTVSITGVAEDAIYSSDFGNYATVEIGTCCQGSNQYAIRDYFSNSYGATLKAIGTIQAASFYNYDGIISPGSSPGTLTFDGGVDLSTATLDMEIDGATCGANDLIDVNGTAFLTGGTLNVSLIGGCTPTVGQTFTLLTAIAITGTFGTINYPNVSGIAWTATYNSTSVVVSALSALPVELTSFEAAAQNDQSALLTWETASERDNEGFQIEHSMDGRNWEAIGHLSGHGTTPVAQSYSFVDERPKLGVNYYRLRQMDFDGQFNFSDVVSLDFSGFENRGSLGLSPNPASGTVNLTFDTDYMGEATLTLFDPIGQSVKTQSLYTEGNSFETQLDLTGLKAGTYSVQFILGKEEKWERLVVQ